MPNYFTEAFINLFGKPRKKNDAITNKHYQIASAMQKVTEEILFHMCNYLKQKVKSKNLVLSGGSIMNSVFNGKISNKSSFKNIFISSCPDDSGLSIGAALALYNVILKKKKRYLQKHNFYGPKYSNDQVIKTLDNLKIKYTKSNKVEQLIAKELSNGKLVGWFQDKMEFGQRALGNRSILADPRNTKMKDKINSAIKFRENVRPFAPAILEEYTLDYFNLNRHHDVPFMEKVFMIKKSKQKFIPAVTHKDGSGRLQTVTRKYNQKFYSLISEFYNITGIPILLNTSFNINNEPIVCSPSDAVKTFYSCGLDILVINNFIIKKN